MELTWICDICGKRRPDGAISVHTRDISEIFNLSPGMAHENIKFCNDKDKCSAGAVYKTFFKAVEKCQPVR